MMRTWRHRGVAYLSRCQQVHTIVTVWRRCIGSTHPKQSPNKRAAPAVSVTTAWYTMWGSNPQMQPVGYHRTASVCYCMHSFTCYSPSVPTPQPSLGIPHVADYTRPYWPQQNNRQQNKRCMYSSPWIYTTAQGGGGARSLAALNSRGGSENIVLQSSTYCASHALKHVKVRILNPPTVAGQQAGQLLLLFRLRGRRELAAHLCERSLHMYILSVEYSTLVYS